MNDRYAQGTRRLVLIAVAAALAAPAPAIAGRGNEQEALNPVIRNDVAHFGRPAASERSSPHASNDRAHFGNEPDSPASTAQGRGTAPIVIRIGGGFDWISAGVGAAGMLGLTLLVGAAASALRRRNRVGTASA